MRLQGTRTCTRCLCVPRVRLVIADVNVSTHSGHPTRGCISKEARASSSSHSTTRAHNLRGQQIPSPRPWKMIRYFHSTVLPGHLWCDKWTALSAPLSGCDLEAKGGSHLCSLVPALESDSPDMRFLSRTRLSWAKKSSDLEARARGVRIDLQNVLDD